VEPGGHELVLSPAGFAPVRLDALDGRVSGTDSRERAGNCAQP
jgi:hypothetical protein